MDTRFVETQRKCKEKHGAETAPTNTNGEVHNMGRNSREGEACNLNVSNVTKPHVGMNFESEEAAKTLYDAYARHVGFSIHVGWYNRIRPDGPVISWEFACSSEIYKRKNVESCNAMLRIERKNPNGWFVTKFVDDHNHSLVSPGKVHHLRPRRHFAGSARNAGDSNEAPADVYTSMDGHYVSYEPNLVVRNISPVGPNWDASATNMGPMNYVRTCFQKRTLGIDAQNLLNYFRKMQTENPGFYYAIQLDDDNRMTNVFWADARSRTSYNYFGDAVVFDTMYRPNQYQVPFAPFTGVNHHGQMVLFGCALLLDESEASFTWLFRTWLSAMNDCPPVSIITDQDRAIQAAVKHVLPETCHCICKWHILREGQERLAHIYLAHPDLYGQLYSCINFSETIEEFESSWISLLDRYDLQKNEWLQAVYNARTQWAPVYFRGTFFAALSNHGVGSFFDGYVTQQTTISLFFKQYETALEHALEKEIEADYDTIRTTPPLRTPSPMEQQAANLYTKKVFAKFQEELVETFVYTANKIDGDSLISKFRVAKYEHDDKAYMVTLNISEMIASCSCQMFEYSGILCRHVLTVFTVTNVLTLPSHYILKRWTRNAKSGMRLDGEELQSQGVETLTSRFKNLCLEAIKYAEECATSAETYNVAMSALRESGKKVAVMKKNVAKAIPPCFHSSGSGIKESNKKAPSDVPETPPSGWSSQDIIPNRFNCNVAGASVSDFNPRSFCPVSLHRDGGVTADYTGIVTCFKSMTWVIENQSSFPASKVAVINLKLQDCGMSPSGETEVQFRLTKVTLEPMLRSMSFISQQLSAPANKVAVINLKLQDTMVTSGETEVKFQVTRDTLGFMLRSLVYIREQL